MKSTATDRNVGQVAGKIPTSGKTSETWGSQNLPLSRRAYVRPTHVSTKVKSDGKGCPFYKSTAKSD
jgi:hypothetical protein